MYAGVVDEEYRMRGAAALADALSACGTRIVAAVVAEPTELRIIRAHKGIVRAVIDVHGTAAHSSKPPPGRQRDQRRGPVDHGVRRGGGRRLRCAG